MQKTRRKVLEMTALAKKKDITREQALEQARALHKSISKRMSGAGLSAKSIKKDVLKARLDVRRSNYSGGH
ncbi:MAG: hypothetical protein K6T65_15820 [Peptococcaceae bacterium]|nr:hypothetical protein [Peptococcaceae bacterium]